MNVVAFRPRPDRAGPRSARPDTTPITGTFRSPRGRSGVMTGSLRVQRLVLVPRGAFVTGVFTGELREQDGVVVGVDSRRGTVQADLVLGESGLQPVVRAFQLDLMGITVEVRSFLVDPWLAFPRQEARARRSRDGRGRRGERSAPGHLELL
jgi:hypothetical protein